MNSRLDYCFARQHVDSATLIYHACPSVCPVLLVRRNSYTNRQMFSTIILVFEPNLRYKIPMVRQRLRIIQR